MQKGGHQIHGIKSVHVPPGKNPYKLVALDLDGTLLRNNHEVSERTRRTLSQLLARGVHVIFATGRPFTDVNRIKRHLDIFAKVSSIPTSGLQVVTPAVRSPVGPLPSSVSDTGSVASLNSSPCRGSERIIPRCYAITSNGACVYDEANQRVYERCIDPRLCRELYAMFIDDPEVNVNIFRGVDASERAKAGYTNPSDLGDDKASDEWVSRYPSDLEAALYHQSHFTFRVVPDLEKSFATDHVNEIFFLCYNHDKADKVEQSISERVAALKAELKLETTVRVAPSATYCLDIIPEGVSKASALQYVLNEVGLTMADVIAFGDGLNDVEMLSAVGKGCIMGNANPRLKTRLPDLEVVGTNDEDGVAQKLTEVFGLDVDAADGNGSRTA